MDDVDGENDLDIFEVLFSPQTNQSSQRSSTSVLSTLGRTANNGLVQRPASEYARETSAHTSQPTTPYLPPTQTQTTLQPHTSYVPVQLHNIDYYGGAMYSNSNTQNAQYQGQIENNFGPNQNGQHYQNYPPFTPNPNYPSNTTIPPQQSQLGQYGNSYNHTNGGQNGYVVGGGYGQFGYGNYRHPNLSGSASTQSQTSTSSQNPYPGMSNGDDAFSTAGRIDGERDNQSDDDIVVVDHKTPHPSQPIQSHQQQYQPTQAQQHRQYQQQSQVQPHVIPQPQQQPQPQSNYPAYQQPYQPPPPTTQPIPQQPMSSLDLGATQQNPIQMIAQLAKLLELSSSLALSQQQVGQQPPPRQQQPHHRLQPKQLQLQQQPQQQ